MELKTIKNNWFWLAITAYLTVGLYLCYVNYSAPFLSIELKEEDGQWLIADPYYKEWAAKKQILPGDVVLSIDDVPIEDVPNIKYEYLIRSAKGLTILKPNGQILDVQISHLDIPEQFFYILIIPTFYFLLTFIISLFLYYKQKNTPLLNLLMLFMLTVSLAYVSSGASGRLNDAGIIVNRSSMLLCLVLLLHFFRDYFTFININGVFLRNIRLFYIVPVTAFLLGIFSVIFPSANNLLSFIVLALFLCMLFLILGIFLYSYFKYKTPQLKILLYSMITPFLPFILLYALPEIIFHESILSAEISALFLLLIPFSFIFTQLTERLFDIEYYITRLRYYIIFSFVFTTWIILGVYWVVGSLISLVKLSGIFFFTFGSLIILFYIKEKVDYRKRKILFSTKGDYIHQLYSAVDKIGKATKIEELLEKFIQAVSLHLEINHLFVLTYDYERQEFTTVIEGVEPIDSVLLEELRLGEIRKTNTVYLAFLHQDTHYKRILVLGHNKSIHLKEEELLWLELLLLYVSNCIENSKMVEELLEELKHMKQNDENQLPWLNKLLWLRFEEEKYQLAQELHDTNLQEQLHIAREVDVLIHAKNSKSIQEELVKIHEQMIASVHDLRAYCENLKPPLLDTLGLNPALEKLIRKVKHRADFILIYTIDRLYLEDERLNLMIYRLFQELLNNAIKHSNATMVEIYLKEEIDGFVITYTDNGIGCDINDIIQADSMGIKGMQERIKAFNGQFHINSNINEGMAIRIIVREGSDTLDYDAHSG